MTKRTTLSLLGLPVLAALTFGVAACGGDGGGSSSTTVSIPAGAVVVDAGPGLQFDKTEYTATAGSVTIAYLQRDIQRHTLVVQDASGVMIPPKLEVVKKGEVSTGTYDLVAGTYDIHCDVPGHGTMRAKLIVS